MRIIKYLIFIVILCALICISDLLQKYTLMPDIEYEFKFMEILNFLATVCIGLSIPYYISKSIDNVKAIRIFLIGECKEMLEDTFKINSLITDIDINVAVNESSKNEILFLLEKAEKKLDNLIFYLEKANLPKEIYNSDDFKRSFLKYWDDVTGGQLMSDGFVFNDEFRSLTASSFYELEKDIKGYIIELSKT